MMRWLKSYRTTPLYANNMLLSKQISFFVVVLRS